MAKVKFRRTVADCFAKRKYICLIDRGATHHFICSRFIFESYESVESETVESASGKSRLVGMGIVTLSFDGAILIEAYHAPQFSSQIISIGKQPVSHDVHCSSRSRGQVGTSTRKITSVKEDRVVLEQEISDELYRIDFPNKSPIFTYWMKIEPVKVHCSIFANMDERHLNKGNTKGGKSKSEMNDPKGEHFGSSVAVGLSSNQSTKAIKNSLHWNRILRHPYLERVIRILNSRPDLPQFAQSFIRAIHCHPYFV